MYASSILFALATAVGLINAVAIPQPGNPNYDTCINEFGTVFAGAPTPEIATCSGCAGDAFMEAFFVYGGDPDNVEAAKNEYNTQMAQCHESDADERYNTCLNEYATIFAAEFTPGPAECTGCAATALAVGLVAYGTMEGDLDAKVAAAKSAYTASMDECPGA